MSRKKIDPATDVLRIVSMLARKGDYSGIVDGDDTPLGALVDAILSIKGGMAYDSSEREKQIVAVFVSLVRSVPPRVLATMHAAALEQEALHHKWDREAAEAQVAEWAP